MEEKIRLLFKKNNIELSNIQVKQFKEYYSYLVEENGKYNLTAITNFEDVVKKHFIDSVLPYKNFKPGAKVIDVGTGAGFPGVPLKILRPDIEVVLLDSLNKRVKFLNNLTSMLSLTKISAVHSRAEDYAEKNREKFDYAVSRAVARSATLSEYLLPFVKIGGYAVFYKSQDIKEELDEAKKAIELFGGYVTKVENCDVFENKRSIVYIFKENHTPKQYPRSKNLPKTKPII